MSPLDLLPLPLSERVSTDGKNKAETIRKLHEQVNANIKAKTKIYARKANKKRNKVVFEEGDLVWVHLRKERFPDERKSKLMPRVDGPFQILKKISDNAYQLDLKGKYEISSSFNVSDLSPFLADDPDLWTNPFEEEGNDAPQSINQYMEPDQGDDQDVQNNSVEVRSANRTSQDDRAVYRLDPRTSGMELRLDPRPDDRTDRTRPYLSRPTRQSKTNGQTRIDLERAEQESGRDFSLLARLGRTARTGVRADELIDHFDQFLYFDQPNLTKAWSLHFSEDLGRLWYSLGRETDVMVHTDSPKPVLLLTARHAEETLNLDAS